MFVLSFQKKKKKPLKDWTLKVNKWIVLILTKIKAKPFGRQKIKKAKHNKMSIKMPSIAAWACIMSFMLVVSSAAAIRSDDKNITRLLNNQVIVSRQIMCVLEKSPCDQLGRQLKAALPEVIIRNCRNCSPQQAQNAQKLTTFLQTRYPDVWAMLIKKYRGV